MGQVVPNVEITGAERPGWAYLLETKLTDEIMLYVAADPTQPCAAWAACVDDPSCEKYTAKDIAQWVRQGATIMRVTPEVAREMMTKWVRPEKKPKVARQARRGT